MCCVYVCCVCVHECMHVCVHVCVYACGTGVHTICACTGVLCMYMCTCVHEWEGGDHKTLEVNLTKDVSSQLQFGFIQVQAVAHLLLPK